MKDLESMSRKELERAHRDARITGDSAAADAAEEEMERRDLGGEGYSQAWAEEEA